MNCIDMRTRYMGYLTLLVVGAALAGCGKYRTAPVAGVVTLDDKPLEDATVTFTPVEAVEGEVIMSTGRTDAEGRYSLELLTDQSEGAVVGHHTVRISKNIETESDIMTAAEAKQSALPPHDFEFDVESGSNEANFNLSSKSRK